MDSADENGDKVLAPPPRLPIVDMDLAYPPPEWVVYGSCAQPEFIAEHGYDFMFPEGYGPISAKAQREVCGKCPVSLLCAEYGKDEPWGVWGETTRRTRLLAGNGQGREHDPDTGQLMARSNGGNPLGKGKRNA